MRAREYLFEDNRSKIEKLQELVNHPNTEETVRRVALSRLEVLLASETENKPSVMMVETNVTAEELDQHFLTGITLRQLYEGLCGLSPCPNSIQFLRQGQIQMMVPPPFMGKTRNQYVAEVQAACPGVRQITSRMVEGQGYIFLISYV